MAKLKRFLTPGVPTPAERDALFAALTRPEPLRPEPKPKLAKP